MRHAAILQRKTASLPTEQLWLTLDILFWYIDIGCEMPTPKKIAPPAWRWVQAIYNTCFGARIRILQTVP